MIFEGGRDLDLLPLTGAVSSPQERRLESVRPAVGVLNGCVISFGLWVLFGGLLWVLLVLGGVD